MPSVNRNVLIAGAVLLLHLAALWALQSGLLHRAVELVVPVQVISEFVAPVPPLAARPVPPPPTPAPPLPTQAVARPQSTPVLAAAPQPLAVADAAPSPTAPTGVVAPQPPAPPIAAPVAPAAVTPAHPPVAAKVELPSSDADYLHNPKPKYPPLSERKGERGRVVVRVLIGVDGSAKQAEIQSSSGFERLDQAALAAAQGWRYVPGKRAGVAEAMWVEVPISFGTE